ncbi:MAG: PaaI family thioesterase [Betaproteobacteria bacterium]|nr:MAG: PaaI family thioesterase [Betaproteobacteria bacterium]
MSSQPTAAQEPAFAPLNSDYEARVRDSFARQGAMRLLGARLAEVRAGYCAIELPYRDDLTQQHGYVHAGIVGAIVDSAGGYAGFTLFPKDASVLTVEYKLNLLAPAAGERLVAQATVLKPGRTLAITRGEVYAEARGQRTLCAVMQQTLIVLAGKPDA